MQHAAPIPSPPIALEVSLARGAKEIVRAAAGFALFLALLVPARWVGFDHLYARPVLAVAQAIVLSTQHFPVLASMDNLTLRNLHFSVILAFALFLVSTNVGLASRLRRFGLLFGALFAFHVLVAIVTTEVRVAQDLESSTQILVLTPAEFRVMDWLKYFCYDLGLEIASFVVLLLAVIWNLAPRRAPPSQAKRRASHERAVKRGRSRDQGPIRRRRLAVVAGVGAIAILVSAAAVYGRVRESIPSHVQAHAKLGHLFWKAHKEAKAADQYRCAVAGGTSDPEVFYNLSRLEARLGNRGAALRLIHQGMELTREPEWQARFQQTLEVMHTKATIP